MKFFCGRYGVQSRFCSNPPFGTSPNSSAPLVRFASSEEAGLARLLSVPFGHRRTCQSRTSAVTGNRPCKAVSSYQAGRDGFERISFAYFTEMPLPISSANRGAGSQKPSCQGFTYSSSETYPKGLWRGRIPNHRLLVSRSYPHISWPGPLRRSPSLRILAS